MNELREHLIGAGIIRPRAVDLDGPTFPDVGHDKPTLRLDAEGRAAARHHAALGPVVLRRSAPRLQQNGASAKGAA